MVGTPTDLVGAVAHTAVPCARPGQEAEHPLGHQCRRLRVVGGQRAVGEVVRVAGVEEELAVLGLVDQRPGGLDVALVDEDRVGVHPVDLHRDPGRPAAELRRRDARVAEQRAAGAGPGLGEALRRQHAEGEPQVDQCGRKPLDRADPPLHHLAEADLPHVRHPVLQGRERAALVQVGRVHGVPGRAQVVGERDDAGREPLCVVEQHDLGHGASSPVRVRGRPHSRDGL